MRGSRGARAGNHKPTVPASMRSDCGLLSMIQAWNEAPGTASVSAVCRRRNQIEHFKRISHVRNRSHSYYVSAYDLYIINQNCFMLMSFLALSLQCSLGSAPVRFAFEFQRPVHKPNEHRSSWFSRFQLSSNRLSSLPQFILSELKKTTPKIKIFALWDCWEIVEI